MGVEGEVEVERALRHLRDDKGVDPDIVVHDFYPATCAGVESVYGVEKSAIDPFHVMQEVNRGIGKDLARFRDQRFASEVRELGAMTTCFSALQAQLAGGGVIPRDVLAMLPAVAPGHALAQLCAEVSQAALAALRIPRAAKFFPALREELEAIQCRPELPAKAFAMSVEEHVPRRATTEKARARAAADVLKKLKTMCAESRQYLQVQQAQFSREKWVLFYQPERLTPPRSRLLARFLAKYPELEPYRDLTLGVGSIYRLPLSLVSNAFIDCLPDGPAWGAELQAAIATLKGHRDEILRFREFYAKNPDLPKKCRANTEYLNQRFKAVFQSGLYLKGWDRLENELQLQMGGEIRNFVATL